MDIKEIKPVNPKENQPRISIGRTEAPILWTLDPKSWLIGKEWDTGRDWRQEGKGVTENEMVGWYHWLNAHEPEQTPGDREQGSLVCCSLWSCKESDMTEWLNKNNFIWYGYCYFCFLLTSICMEYLFLSPHFQSVCVPGSKMGLTDSVYTDLIFVSIEPFCVFWFKYLIHLHLR